ncbi:MAG: MFS transporter [Acidimicrobiales bacterium]|nr:MFS transporter [Acidimicrobiales bacterium]
MPKEQNANGQVPTKVKILLIASFFSALATVGQITIVGKQVYDMTGSELNLGLLGLAEFLPLALLSPFTGPVADRFDRRKVFSLALLAEALASFFLFLYISSEPTSVTPIFGLIALFGVARAFATPASRALPIDWSPDNVVERVVALKSVAFQAGIIVGPALFGFIFVLGRSFPYLAAVISYGIANLLLLTVGPSAIKKLGTSGSKQAFRDALEGLKFIKKSPVLYGAISLDLMAVLFGGAVALLPAIAEDRLGVGAVGLGWLRAGVGIGASIVAITLSVRPLRRHIGKSLLKAVSVFGCGTIVLGLSSSFILAFVALIILSGADAISVYIRASLVPLATPEEMRGRVLAVEGVFIGASNELGAVESGLTAAAFGLVGAILFGGFGTLAVVAIWWRFFPALRNVQSFSEVKPDSS